MTENLAQAAVSGVVEGLRKADVPDHAIQDALFEEANTVASQRWPGGGDTDD